MNTNPLNVYILVDRSGSMASRIGETIGSLNAYLDGLREKNVAARVTVACFDEKGGGLDFSVLRDAQSLYDLKPLNTTEVTPRGGTPLFDALSRLNGLVSGERASILIMTDGEENSSREVTREGAKAIVDGFTARGFDVVYIGADFNAFGQASAVGIRGSQTLNTAQGAYTAAMNMMSSRSAVYASGVCAQSLNFSDEDRAKALGQNVNIKA